MRSRIDDGDNDILVSMASVWEMAIKHSRGMLSFQQPFMEFIRQQLTINRMELLPIKLEHLEVVARLPFHHRDPFDRLIIAQSICEEIPLLSVDGMFDAYGITRFW
jgi:PIN domain nuclease of toxin-antitoxin system